MKRFLLGLLVIFVVACCCTTRIYPPEDTGPALTEVQEQETCGDDVNEGCNAKPPSRQDFDYIDCNEIIYGTSWCDRTWRDTDWYLFTLDTVSEVTITCKAEFELLMFLLGPASPPEVCPYQPYYTLPVFKLNTSVSLTTTLDAATYYIWVGQRNWKTILNCGENNTYWMSLVCSSVTEDSPTILTSKEDNFDVSLLRKEK